MQPKVAICVSGQLRTIDKCINNIKEFIGDIDADFFLHTWDLNTSVPVYSQPAPHGSISYIPDRVLQRQVKLFDPKIYEIQFYRQYQCSVDKQPNPYNVSFFALFYSWVRSVRMMDQYRRETGTQYDICVKIRPDVIYSREKNLKYYVNLFIKNNYPRSFWSNMAWIEPTGRYTMDDIVYMSSADTMLEISRKWWQKYYTLNLHDPHHGYSVHTQFVDYIKELGYDPIGVNSVDPSGLGMNQTILRPECEYHAIKEYNKCFEFERIFFLGDHDLYRNMKHISREEFLNDARRVMKLRNHLPDFMQDDLQGII